MQQCQEGQIQFACCGHCRKLLRSSRHFCVWFTYTMDCGGQRLTGTNGLWRNCAGNLEFLFRLCAAMRQNMPVIEDQKENDYADVAAMLEKCQLLADAGYRPYYLYRQKNTLQNLENVGWCKPGHEGYYNIYIMEEVQTILSAGAGGSTKLVADGGRRMQRIFNFKYPTEYIQRFAEVLERKKGVADFYDHDLGPETSG